MADALVPQLTVDDVRGMKQLRRVAKLLSFLHDVGCDRDRAGNRELHYDDYVILVLLYLFSRPGVSQSSGGQESFPLRWWRGGVTV